MGVERIVAAVLDEARGEEADAHRLRKQRDELRCNQRRAQNVDLAVCEAILQCISLGQLLAQLDGPLLAARREGADVMRYVEESGELQVQIRIALKLRR
jgi:hypothetical protein